MVNMVKGIFGVNGRDTYIVGPTQYAVTKVTAASVPIMPGIPVPADMGQIVAGLHGTGGGGGNVNQAGSSTITYGPGEAGYQGAIFVVFVFSDQGAAL
jgi:hypothetical protein